MGPPETDLRDSRTHRYRWGGAYSARLERLVPAELVAALTIGGCMR